MSRRTLEEYEKSLENDKQCTVVKDKRNTQMCWFILTGQPCQYKDCSFAHTMEEHKTPESYKTVFCRVSISSLALSLYIFSMTTARFTGYQVIPH
jgi:hypothetical protein